MSERGWGGRNAGWSSEGSGLMWSLCRGHDKKSMTQSGWWVRGWARGGIMKVVQWGPWFLRGGGVGVLRARQAKG
eukprot:755798-Hanusia_phi.AAC.2